MHDTAYVAITCWTGFIIA